MAHVQLHLALPNVICSEILIRYTHINMKVKFSLEEKALERKPVKSGRKPAPALTGEKENAATTFPRGWTPLRYDPHKLASQEEQDG